MSYVSWLFTSICFCRFSGSFALKYLDTVKQYEFLGPGEATDHVVKALFLLNYFLPQRALQATVPGLLDLHFL